MTNKVPNIVFEQYEAMKCLGNINMSNLSNVMNSAMDIGFGDFLRYVSYDIVKYQNILLQYSDWRDKKPIMRLIHCTKCGVGSGIVVRINCAECGRNLL